MSDGVIACFDNDLGLGAVGEGIMTRLWDERSIAYEDLTKDPVYQKMDIDFRIYKNKRPVLVDVKTHNSWDRFSVETISDVNRGIGGCDFTTKAEFLIRVFPIIETIMVVRQKRFLKLIEDDPRWNKQKEWPSTTYRHGSVWHSMYKLWNFDYMPEDGRGVWWQTFDFTLTENEILTLFKYKNFVKNAITYESIPGNLPIFNLGDKIRCPTCLQKGIPGDMKLKPQGDGSIFFGCENWKEHKKEGLLSSFEPNGRNKRGNRVSVYPMRFMHRLAGNGTTISNPIPLPFPVP